MESVGQNLFAATKSHISLILPKRVVRRPKQLNILVTGGAGYIGSHACKALAARGFVPITYDNLSRGNRWAVKWGPFEEGDIGDGCARS